MNSFQAVNTIYEIANKYELHFHRLQHYSLRNFSTALYHLEKAISRSQLSHDLLLGDLISNFRKYRFYVVASLISFDNYNTFLDKNKLEQLYNRCRLLFPNILDELENCYMAFESLIKSDENPVLHYIKENIDTRLYTGVILKATSDYEATKQLIESLSVQSQCKLIGSQVLKTNTFFEQLIVIGPSRWFPNFIYNSPHAPKIHTVTYKWLERKFQEESYLEGETTKSTIFSGRCVTYHDPFFQRDELEEVIFDTNIEKTVDYSHLEQEIKAKKQKNENDEKDIVAARLVILSGNKGIFFEDVSLKNIFSIYSDSDGFTIGRTSINEIEPNSYVLVRTGTKQDLIRTKADEIIGISAQTYRKFHMRWKNRLKKIVQRNGIGSVHLALKKLGVKNPTEANIRNWMSEDNIMPASETDFKAILEFVKLGEDESKHIKVAKLLRRAHQEAGSLIRKKLIEEIKNTDLSSLELRGEHVFNLPDEKGVAFTAYRVEHISEQNYYIPSDELKEVISLR
ncbi:hypothetical protein PB1_12199 [Bacillus methanolicus PB1]|uniref:DISARM protein DrmE C-terminal domain-containing protein n=1 Tax=Bacillus methanolicus PB1 TaxID=997296 RepID=I3DVQ1_BACMT|nr:hypothetical protein [Bacillus methanolicus]EIJ78322.1 hypothetical protein PB1_12199 [Bacillus methanolicus PB1]